MNSIKLAVFIGIIFALVTAANVYALQMSTSISTAAGFSEERDAASYSIDIGGGADEQYDGYYSGDWDWSGKKKKKPPLTCSEADNKACEKLCIMKGPPDEMKGSLLGIMLVSGKCNIIEGKKMCVCTWAYKSSDMMNVV